MTPHVLAAPLDTASVADLSILGTVLASHGANSAEVIALTDEGRLTLVGCWPKQDGSDRVDQSAWTDHTWAIYLELLSRGHDSHHVCGDGRVLYPLTMEGLLWGAAVVDPGCACPDALAMALAAHERSLVYMVRANA